VDLPRTDPRLLELYMGDLMPGYLKHHDEAVMSGTGEWQGQVRCA
jgi:hypothetical protein